MNNTMTFCTLNANIDEELLKRHEDPVVIKQKQELLRAFATQLKTLLLEHQNDSKKQLKRLLRNIYGCAALEVKQYCALFGIHEQTRITEVPPLFWGVLLLHLNKYPRFGAENVLVEAQSIRRMIEKQTKRGFRHVMAYPMTRRNHKAKNQKKLGPIRARRLGFYCIRNEPGWKSKHQKK